MPSKRQLLRGMGRSRSALTRAKETGITISGDAFVVALARGSAGFEIGDQGPAVVANGITFLISKALLARVPHGAEVRLTDPGADTAAYTIASHRDQGEHWLIKADTYRS